MRRATPSRKQNAFNPADKDTSQIYIGVDEAGYGPNLGPLVVAATAFVGRQSHCGVDWWGLAPDRIGRAGVQDRLVIDDSKAVLTRPSGHAQLARTVHGLLQMTERSPRSLAELFQCLAPRDQSALAAEHWYRENDETPIERFFGASHASEDDPPDVMGDVRASWDAMNLKVLPPCARVMFPRFFNENLDWSSNKAEVELTLVLDVLRHQLDAVKDVSRVQITVDRLGGRRYYRALVEDLAKTAFVFTLAEDPHESAYRFEQAGCEVEIYFRVKGDQSSMPVAAASMVAKYLRECCMTSFNAFWKEHIPALVPTAGYPNDARRFLKDVRPKLEALGIPMEAFWRSK